VGAVVIAARVVLAAAALDLASRQVARASLWAEIGVRAHATTVLVVALLAASLGLAAAWQRAWRGAVSVALGAAFVTGLATQLRLGARLQSDGFYYYAYLRSLAFDRDVNFTNDYALLGLGDKRHLFEPTPTGYAHSAWTIGPAIVWSPFFAAGHLVAGNRAGSNPDVSANGVSFPYRQAVCVAGLFYGLVGCWFCYRIAARFHSARLAAAATAVVLGGSFMLWYLVKEPSMTHAPSMAAVAGFIWAWLATRGRPTMAQWALLGLLAGFMTLVRWQNALFALLPAIDAVTAIAVAWRRSDRQAVAWTIGAGLLFTACAAAAFLPQMIAWKSIYGSWLAVSPVGPQIRWSDPHLVDILWSSRNGLLATSPALYCAAVGLVVFAVRRPAVGLPMVLATAAMIYFNSIIQDWWGSDGYGMRRFDGVIPFFAIGLATFAGLVADAVRRWPSSAPALAGAALVLWNLTLVHTAATGSLRIGETTSMGAVAAHQAEAAVRWIGHPPSWPINILFAWRNGVGPSEYDLLRVNAFLGDPARPYGRVDVGTDDDVFVVSGWHAPERDGATSFRWASQRAELLVPLDHRADLRVQVRVRPFTPPGRPAQRLRIDVNGRAGGEWTLDGDWQTIEYVAPEAVWRAGVNRVVLTFGGETRPVDAGLGGDTRALSAGVDYLRVQKVGD
jgi:hypothetical protein